MQIKTQDKIVQNVLRKMDERSLIGQKKDLNRFIVDVQEELMDAILYLESARHCLRDEIEEAMLNRMNVIGQNGNDG